MKRSAVVAGKFYEGNTELLTREAQKYVAFDGEKKERRGCVVPHAGYVYSGETAGKVLSRISIPESVVILSPNHTGRGEDFSVWDGGEWETPLGDIPLDEDFRRKVSQIKNAVLDATAHEFEHSIEVILPFLKVLREDVTIIPVTIRCHTLPSLISFGSSLAELIISEKRNILIIASSDMTHHESSESAEKKDRRCIQKMIEMDLKGLFDLITGERISMCGISPVISMLAACRKQGTERGELIEYTNSGRASGDYASVVGYAGLVF